VSDLETFKALYEQWATAVSQRDRDAFDRLFHRDYTYTSPDGQRMSREQIINVEMDVPPPELPFLDLQVQRFDEIAIVRGRHRLQGDFPGGHVRPELAEEIARGVQVAFSSVWLQEEDGWHVVSNDAHIVRGDGT
jgi:ketosteroid isomerase-like protein